MKAVGYQKSQAIEKDDSLIDIELAKPEAKGQDLLVNVCAISVNPVDAKIRNSVDADDGEYKVIGWDAVGEVVDVGEEVDLFSVGDRVWYAGDLTRSGCNAEYQLVDQRVAGFAPQTLDDAQAAALPLTTITAWELLFDRLGLRYFITPVKHNNTRLLIIGAAGGVGSVLTQLAVQFTDAIVIGTASREKSQQWVEECGADYVLDHSKPLFAELQAIGLDYVTHVISLNHTDQHFDEIVKCLAPQGKLALIDDPVELMDIVQLKRKSISIHWEFMFTRPMFTTEDMIEQHFLLNKVAELVDSGWIKSTLKAVPGCINAENLKQAHADIETNKTVGKIVLLGFDG